MTASELLRNNQLHQTPIRLHLLKILNEAKQPLTVKEIEGLMPQRYDRVTMYRTLKLFVDKNMVHRISVNETLVSYRLHQDNRHMHFHCQCCNAVFCLTDIPFQPVEVPAGFVVTDNSFVVNGVCSTCNCGIKDLK